MLSGLLNILFLQIEPESEAYSYGYALGYVLTPLVLGALYFLPSILGRKKRNFTSIFLVNLLLGWSLIGWVVALVWAVSVETPPVVVQASTPVPAAPSVADELDKLARLRDNGTLNQQEFEQQKERLLSKA